MFVRVVPAVKRGDGEQCQSSGSSAHPGFDGTQGTLKPGKIEAVRRGVYRLAASDGIERRSERFAGSVTGGRFLGEAAHDDAIKRGRNGGVEVRWRGRLHGNDLRANCGHGCTVKRTNSGDHLVEDDAHGENVGAVVLRF